MIELDNCDTVDPLDRSVCELCDDSYIWDPIQKICDSCSEIIPDCHKCSFSDDGRIVCDECQGNLEVWEQTGECYESHCEI